MWEMNEWGERKYFNLKSLLTANNQAIDAGKVAIDTCWLMLQYPGVLEKEISEPPTTFAPQRTNHSHNSDHHGARLHQGVNQVHQLSCNKRASTLQCMDEWELIGVAHDFGGICT